MELEILLLFLATVAVLAPSRGADSRRDDPRDRPNWPR